MIVEILPDEDWERFFNQYPFRDRINPNICKRLSLADAKRIIREEGCVEIGFSDFGTFYFHDFDFYNCFFDNEYYTLGLHRMATFQHDERYVKFMSEHPVYGEQWKKLFAQKLEQEKTLRNKKKTANIAEAEPLND